MNVIVTAGGETDSKDPLYEAARGGLKSMIELDGKPMIQWVLDALGQSQATERVIVVGLPPETDIVCNHPLILLPNEGSMFNNIQSGAQEIQRLEPTAEHALLLTSDIPALRGEMVDWFVQQTDGLDQDAYLTVIDRKSMEVGFPSNKIDYTHLKDQELCIGNLHCFRLQIANQETPLWKRLIESRKKPLRQASLIGYDTMLFMLLRQLSMKDAEAAVCKRLGLQGKAVLCPYPEIGMDIDKPAQLEIMREYFAKRHEQNSAPPLSN